MNLKVLCNYKCCYQADFLGFFGISNMFEVHTCTFNHAFCLNAFKKSWAPGYRSYSCCKPDSSWLFHHFQTDLHLKFTAAYITNGSMAKPAQGNPRYKHEIFHQNQNKSYVFNAKHKLLSALLLLICHSDQNIAYRKVKNTSVEQVQGEIIIFCTYQKSCFLKGIQILWLLSGFIQSMWMFLRKTASILCWIRKPSVQTGSL